MQNNNSAILTIDFKHFWHVGSGKGSGYYLDAICDRDAMGLPYLSGRQLKGLLRQAVNRAEAWGWFKDIPVQDGFFKTHENILFGTNNQETSRDKTQPGILIVGNAHIPSDEAEYLAFGGTSSRSGELKSSLFSELFSTAIDENSGTAKKYSLRGKEVSIPLTLCSDIHLEQTAIHAELRKQQDEYITSGNAWKTLSLAQSLIDSLGANRTRGLGEAVLRLNYNTVTQL